ncbi:Stf0 family sulfotransferase [Cytobacillus sp. NJ13]|nr:Stf0 family sulfotransferase [Cytobacillus sp. NJ13]
MILSTQRSGSTMLCEDIKSLGVLGTPEEHFWQVLNQNKGTAGEQLVEYFTSNGNLNNSDFYSIKLMYNHLDMFGFWISDRVLDTETNTKNIVNLHCSF